MQGGAERVLVNALQQQPVMIALQGLLKQEKSIVGDGLLNLPVAWMAVVVFGATYVITGGIYLLVTKLAVNERARAFKAVSPGMLPPPVAT